MKKIVAMLLALLLGLFGGSAVGENLQPAVDEFSFADIAGLTFTYYSGVGAWMCEMVFDEQGYFTGLYHDTDMGDDGEGYPDGTVYESSFNGRMTVEGPGEKTNTWVLKVTELSLAEDLTDGSVIIEDGVRYIVTGPVGVSLDLHPVLYTPGAALDAVNEDAAYWFHLEDYELQSGDVLPVYGLYDADIQAGFVAAPLE